MLIYRKKHYLFIISLDLNKLKKLCMQETHSPTFKFEIASFDIH